MTKEEIEHMLQVFNEKYGRNPKKSEYGSSGNLGLPAYTTVGRVLGYYPESSFTLGKNRDRYNLSPKICPQCNEPIPYSKRANNFCSQSCAATYNNLLKASCKEKGECLNCGKELKNKKLTYCSGKCHKQYIFTQSLNLWLFVDSDVYHRRAKDYIIFLFGYKCSCCGISEWKGKSVTLELEHVDGNHKNNSIVNLKLLCPNCHSQTPTYKARNKGNGRAARRLRYQQGKSY